MARPSALALAAFLLPGSLLFACGDKDGGGGGDDGGATDSGEEECSLDLPGATTVEVMAECQALVEDLYPMEVQWQWTGNAKFPDYNDPITTPAVADVDGDGVNEVVFTSSGGMAYNGPGLLMILDGETGAEEQAFTGIETEDGDEYGFSGGGNVALADLDGDGVVEILVPMLGPGGGTAPGALHADGTVVWIGPERTTDLFPWGALNVADMDGDGQPEVVGGGVIFKGSNGGYEEANGLGFGGIINITAVADLDGDGSLELITGNSAFTIDGDEVYDRSEDLVDHGAVAVGDFDEDGRGEVATLDYNTGQLLVLDSDGTTIWEDADTFAKTATGGPPTVADFDGDGAPEIAVYAGTLAVVFDGDGTVLWSTEVTDVFAGSNGLSAFDIDGDGDDDLLLTDDASFRILDGEDGAVLLEEQDHAGFTLNGYPVVVDVDGDGATEILLGSNDLFSKGEWSGLTALKDPYDSWAPAGDVWAQHSWYEGARTSEMTVPSSPEMPWDNDDPRWRATPSGERPQIEADAANLQAVVADACWECTDTLIRFELAVTLANSGVVDVDEDLALAVYGITSTGGRELIQTDRIDGGLASGEQAASIQVRGQFATAIGLVALEVQAGGSQAYVEENLDAPLMLDCSVEDDIYRVELAEVCGE